MSCYENRVRIPSVTSPRQGGIHAVTIKYLTTVKLAKALLLSLAITAMSESDSRLEASLGELTDISWDLVVLLETWRVEKCEEFVLR